MKKFVILASFLCLIASSSYAIEYRTSPGTIKKTGKYVVVTEYEKTSFHPEKDKKKCKKDSDGNKASNAESNKKQKECK